MIDDMNFYRNLVVDHLIGDECKTWFEEIDIPSLGVEKVRFSRDDEYHEPILTEDFIEYSANKIKNAPSVHSAVHNGRWCGASGRCAAASVGSINRRSEA